MRQYDHKKIEKKWREAWEKAKLYETKDGVDGKENFYLLVEFPYPSGNLHVGHWYAFALPDILARYLRMKGKNVLYPIGFDAFGLPAENAAIKNKLNPRDWTEKNIAYMTEQIRSMGTSFDWSREVKTIDPEYYKWTQWMFLQFHKARLAYRKETAVNWCPNDKTVLANEQVVDGKCERCGHEVVQKQMLQWNLKITDYADRLVDDLEDLDWPREIKESQRNWIGRSEGAEIDFPLAGDSIRHVVLLHGKGGTADGAFKPWMRQLLEKRGYTVESPQMPGGDSPNDDEQADYVQKHCQLDEHTAVVGHSFGGIVALRLLERGVKLGRVTLVAAPFSGKYLDGKERTTVTEALKKGMDFEKIKKNCKGFIAVYDTGDHVVPMSDGEELSEKLGCYLMKGKGEESHFNGEKEPDVLLATAPGIRVFTTRPDTLFGATYLVLAPEHPWVTLALQHKTVLKNNAEVQKYVSAAASKTELERQTDKEKTGVRLEGVEAVNPATGGKISLFVADYVLAHYGTGAIMAVPAHDERDYAFAHKFELPVRHVVIPRVIDETNPHQEGKEIVFRHAIVGIVRDPKTNKYLVLKWKEQPWTTFITGGRDGDEDPQTAARREIAEETGYTKLKLVRVLGAPIQAEFYAAHKGINRVARVTAVLFELEDDTRQAVAPEELKKHEVAWVGREEVSRNRMQYAELPIVLPRIDSGSDVYTGDGILFDSGEFDGLPIDLAKKAITEKFGRVKTTYKLRDWIVSRQRYWGVPIPMIHCQDCGIVPVPEKDLPVLLPDVDDYLPEGSGKSPLAKAKDWVAVKCPLCGANAERETDTLDTFVDSSWYFLRYTDPRNADKFASLSRQDAWMPVDLYSGGAEHTTMHLLYSRFWHKALYDLKLVADKEPYTKRMNRSLILGPDGQKMSKSRGNVIDPDDVVGRLGADTVRMYLAFIGPYNEVSSYPWNPDGVAGIRRFIERVWRLQEYLQDEDAGELDAELHKTIRKIGDDIGALKFNTAIAQLMVLVNAAEKMKKIGRSQWNVFVRLLAPFAPYVSEELWQDLGHKTSVYDDEWPVYDMEKLKTETVKIVVQIDGKRRDTIEVGQDTSDEAVAAAAKAAVAARLIGTKILRTVVVPNRLVNFVLER